MNFRLEPHHVPPGCAARLDAPADATFLLDWKGGQREIAFRWMRFDRFAFLLWVRIDGELWIATRNPRTESEVPMKWKVPQLSPRKMLSIARTIEHGQVLGLAPPFFRATSNPPEWVLSRVDGSGVWLDSALEIVGEFSLELPSDGSETSWKTRFEAAWNDEESDARFAWNWAKMSEDARREWLYEGSNGLNEIEKIVRLVLQSADELWTNHILLSWTHDFSWVEGFFCGEDCWTVDAKKEAPRLERWRRFIDVQLWKPRFCVVARHRIVRQWIQGAYGSWNVAVEVPKPSFHERLEARLELRDWILQNVSSQRRRWLLPP